MTGHRVFELGDLALQGGAIRAKALILPGETGLYFRAADNQR
jgi:hypothetical protein